MGRIIRNMVFNTPYNRLAYEPRITTGKSRVDLTGYISKERRIKALIEAGERLHPIGQYDFDRGDDIDIDDTVFDRTREKNYDMAEASMSMREMEMRAAENIASQKRQKRPGSISRSEPGQLTPKVSEKALSEAEAPEEKKMSE